MGFFDGFAEGLASAIDDIRHKVVEEPMYGRETTDNLSLPQQQEPAVEPTSWQTAAQDIEPAQQPEPPQPSMEMEQ